MLGFNYYFTKEGSIRFPKYMDYCLYMTIQRDSSWSVKQIVDHAFESDLVDEEETDGLYEKCFDCIANNHPFGRNIY